jgi:hypothetical protein
MENNNIDKVTRFEVIDDSGRVLVRYGIKIELSFQDDDRTLKVFLTSKNNSNKYPKIQINTLNFLP